MIQEQLQDKYYELELYQNEIKSLDNQIKETQEQEEEISFIQKNLSEFKTLKKDDELLVPIANGIFFKAKLVDNKIFRVNVGEGINVDKSLDDTIKLLDKHKRKISDFRNKLIVKINTLLNKKDELERQALALTKEYEKMMKNV